MSDCLEVLFASDSSDKQQSITCFNPHVGTTLMTYRGCGNPSKNCLSLIGSDYILSAEESKPLIHVWVINSQQSSHDLKMVTPGVLSALSITSDGNFCVGGIDGKIYVWQISSGALLSVLTKHYMRINKIVFTDDSSHFVTAGEDGLVLVWKLADVVFRQCGNIFNLPKSQVTPVYTFTEHSLPVTDVFIGRGNLQARLFTVSIDQTCKIYDLSNGELLLSLMFSHVLTALTVNELETELFVGATSGKILSYNLDPYPRSLEHVVADDSATISTFEGHSKKITCLATSLDGVTLASGSDDEKIYLWNIPSRQLVRSIEMKGPVHNLFFSIASNNIFATKFEPSIFVSKFEKISSQDEKNLEVNVCVHDNISPISFETATFPVETDEVEYVEETVEEQGDARNLEQQIKKLKEANRQLYQFAMNKILKNPLDVSYTNGI